MDAGPTDAGQGVTDAGFDAGPPPRCRPGGDGGYVVDPFPLLSQYCLVSQDDGGIDFDPSVIPYAPNSPLFSDYAIKVRGAWIPTGGHATYADDGGPAAFGFPTGSILIKSFGFPKDFREPQQDLRWIETRLLIQTGDAGWKAFTYLWDDGGADAELNYSGEQTPLSFVDGDGGTVSTLYPVPSYGQCKQCHAVEADVVPIGLKGRELNGPYPYPSGTENQLDHWVALGKLTGVPADGGPRAPVWNDPSTGTLEQRARAYLEINCAHCHDAVGYARTTGLFLWANEPDATVSGICKPPVAAGPATGGDSYDIVPGDPAHSIVIYRMSSTVPDIMMPLIDRTLEDGPGVTLVSDWIASLDGGCP